MSRWLLLCLLWLGSASASAVELADLLDLPAERGPRALRSLLLDIAPAGNRLVAVGEYGTILYSDDKGASWKQAEVPVQVTLTAVFFPEPDLGWAVGHDAVILHTQDGGATWSRQLDGRQTGDLLLAGAEQWEAKAITLESSEDADPDELMLLQDAAMLAMDEALREQEIGPNRPFLDVWFSDKNMGYAIGAFNYFFVTEDGGKTWSDASFRLPNPEFLHLYSIASIDSSTLLLVGEFGMVMRSTDTGQTWEQLDLGYDGTLFAANGGEGEAWIGGLRGNVFHSRDAGQNWQRLLQKTEASLLGSIIDGAGRARFVGLSGMLVEIERDSGQAVRVSQISPLTLAAIISVSEQGTVLVGSAGVTRLDEKGSIVPVRYVEYRK
jgi:photosystem II stability/assembly factor-like uncharacterized protein